MYAYALQAVNDVILGPPFSCRQQAALWLTKTSCGSSNKAEPQEAAAMRTL